MLRAHGPQLFVVTILAALLCPATASADGILLESYGGERPQDADELVAPIRAELGSRQYSTGNALAERIATHLSEPATVLPALKLEEAARFIKSGYQQHLGGSWQLAITDLSRGIDLLLSAPVSMVREQERRDQLFDGLVALARSHKRAGNDRDAKRVMSELLRTFPDRELSRAKYPPDVHEYYRAVQRMLTTEGLGRLKVKADDGLMVFVNERFVGLGEITLADIFPGPYRIYVQKGERRGRLHRVEVRPGGSSSIVIRWSLDGALRRDGSCVGFQYENEREREAHEAMNAVEVARAVNASAVAIVGIREQKGRRAVVGTVVSMETGKSVRSAAMSVEPIPPSAEKIRALGRFLAGDEEAAKLFAEMRLGEQHAAAQRDTSPAWYADTLGWTLVGGGLVVAGIGGGLLVNASGLEDDAKVEPDQEERDRLRATASDRRKFGAVLGVAGAVTLAAGIVKLAIHPKRIRHKTEELAVRLGVGSIVVVGRF